MWVAKKKLFGGTLLCTLLILNCAPSARAAWTNVPPAPSRKALLTARKSALSLPSASTAAAARIPAPPIPRLSATRTNLQLPSGTRKYGRADCGTPDFRFIRKSEGVIPRENQTTETDQSFSNRGVWRRAGKCALCAAGGQADGAVSAVLRCG